MSAQPIAIPDVAQAAVPDRKARGAFFTPERIASFLAEWAIDGNAAASVLDPMCGDGAFLRQATRRLLELGAAQDQVSANVFGVDIDQQSLETTARITAAMGAEARLLKADFFDVQAPDTMFSPLPFVDAVIGNPPFVRYQLHSGAARVKSAQAALREGVRLSGLASSWAASLVHASAFLKPEGRIGMVLPAELLTVGYAEPIRRWLRTRFQDVRIIVVEGLQFEDALEKVVLLLANGSGGCEGFSLYHVSEVDELGRVAFRESSVLPAETGKWTELLLRTPERRLFKAIMDSEFVSLASLGSVKLGNVTGANEFFAISEAMRVDWELPIDDFVPIHPPGTRKLVGLEFREADWRDAKSSGERVWLLQPKGEVPGEALVKYLNYGSAQGIPERYKCRIRDPWWRPPAGDAPDLFFTYMSNRNPRLIDNRANVRCLNSMHAVRLKQEARPIGRRTLPLAGLNSLSLLGAELFGRSYGGGILKMEPGEASSMPVPSLSTLATFDAAIKGNRAKLLGETRTRLWTSVSAAVDELLFLDIMKISRRDLSVIQEAAAALRSRRTDAA